MTAQVIWLNGPFGAGKTTTARALSEALGGCRTFDPEWIGAMVETFMAPEHVDDFQNVPLWRALVVKTLATMCAYTDGTILVPMSVLDRDVAADIFGGLAARGIAVTHILLDVEEGVLRERIQAADEHPDNAALSGNTRRWRMSKVGDYLRARPWLIELAHSVVTPRGGPDQVTDQVLRRTSESSQFSPHQHDSQ